MKFGRDRSTRSTRRWISRRNSAERGRNERGGYAVVVAEVGTVANANLAELSRLFLRQIDKNGTHSRWSRIRPSTSSAAAVPRDVYF